MIKELDQLRITQRPSAWIRGVLNPPLMTGNPELFRGNYLVTRALSQLEICEWDDSCGLSVKNVFKMDAITSQK